MSVKIENVDKNLVKLEIEVGSEAVEKGLAYSYKKNIKKVSCQRLSPRKGSAQYRRTLLRRGGII